MGKEKKEEIDVQVQYKPIPDKKRFWLHSENCYTEADLRFREWVLALRKHSGIHPDYLTNPSSWFTEDSEALINVYENAWFYSDTYRPRQVLTRDDFHVQPVDGQRLQWPALYDLMQNVGDYLLIRNQDVRSEHLNDPMNFIFLDLNLILKGLSQNTNIGQVAEQLEHITRYLRTIEKNTHSLVSSDRLFLANFRETIDSKIHPELLHKIDSQLLSHRFEELLKSNNELSMLRNRILHFSLSDHEVNPHSYQFVTDKVAESSTYPTQTAKRCAGESTELSKELSPVLHLSAEQLGACPQFKLIDMREEILDHYAKAITDLNELERFQKVITETIDLLAQAGQAYTIYQFREHMLNLLQQIDRFIDDSSVHIEAIQHANTQAYHKAIYEGQNMGFWKTWFTSEKERLSIFIKNQDTLAQFPSTTADLAKANRMLKGSVSHVISHLNEHSSRGNDMASIASKSHELEQLMGSMHRWVEIQHEINGLPAPAPLEPLKLAFVPPITAIPPSAPLPEVSYQPLFTHPSQIADPECMGDSCPANAGSTISSGNQLAYFGLVTLIPLGLIVFYLLYKYYQKTNEPVPDKKDKFETLQASIDALLCKIKTHEKDSDIDLSEHYDDIVYDYKNLISSARHGIYKTNDLLEIYDDLNYVYENKVRAPAMNPI